MYKRHITDTEILSISDILLQFIIVYTINIMHNKSIYLVEIQHNCIILVNSSPFHLGCTYFMTQCQHQFPYLQYDINKVMFCTIKHTVAAFYQTSHYKYYIDYKFYTEKLIVCPKLHVLKYGRDKKYILAKFIPSLYRKKYIRPGDLSS